MAKRRKIEAWALTRDGELFVPNWTNAHDAWIWRTRKQVDEAKQCFVPGSRHQWAVVKVKISVIGR